MRFQRIACIPMLLLASTMAAQDCLDYGDYLHWERAVDTPGDAVGVAVAGNYAYVADGDNGLGIIWQQCDHNVGIDDRILDPDPEPGDPHQPLTRLATFPNPFNPQTTVSFSLPRAAWTDVSVYELSGRRVVVLASRDFAAGSHTVTWDGRNTHGLAVSSGTYIMRLETADRLQAKKVMLIR